jgi:GNAT superfamily N-acetyltransferase
MRIRRAREEDAPAVGEVIVAAGRAAWRHIFDTSRMTPDAPRWAAMIADAERFWVAETQGGRIVGFASAGPATDPGRGADVGEVLMLHAHPDVWGAGVAARLHDLALFHLSESGRTAAVLRTEERNHRALAFYARRGWTPDGAVLEREFQGSPLREPWLARPSAGPDIVRRRAPADPDVRVLAGVAEHAALVLGDPPRAAVTLADRRLRGDRLEDRERLLDALAELDAGP